MTEALGQFSRDLLNWQWNKNGMSEHNTKRVSLSANMLPDYKINLHRQTRCNHLRSSQWRVAQKEILTRPLCHGRHRRPQTPWKLALRKFQHKMREIFICKMTQKSLLTHNTLNTHWPKIWINAPKQTQAWIAESIQTAFSWLGSMCQASHKPATSTLERNQCKPKTTAIKLCWSHTERVRTDRLQDGVNGIGSVAIGVHRGSGKSSNHKLPAPPCTSQTILKTTCTRWKNGSSEKLIPFQPESTFCDDHVEWTYW